VPSGVPSSKPTASLNPTALFGGGPSACGNCQGACIEVYIMTDNYPQTFQLKMWSRESPDKNKKFMLKRKGYYTQKNTLYSEAVCYNPNPKFKFLRAVRVVVKSKKRNFEGYYSVIVDNGTRTTMRNQESFRRKQITKIPRNLLRSNIIEI